ncbi:MAG: HAD hydrolase-like protein [Candidatus Aenigmarchaeota archaeon]|nr:HAD hydrolase-like protein [Candidatus Aenigmarchaeota archaeon]
MRLVLFDIDKTLVDRKKGDTSKFHHAIEKVYGIKGKRIITHGMTDQQIIIDILKRENLSEKLIMDKIGECKAEIIKYWKEKSKDYEYIVLDGVVELLTELKRNKIPTGLVTGNLEEIAHIKLRMVKIDKFFKFGGFGSDAIKRPDIIKIAIRRAREKFGSGFEDVFVFGDSPKDIEAGKKAGTMTVGVATGIYPPGLLKKSGANYVVKNLKNTKAVLGIINS